MSQMRPTLRDTNRPAVPDPTALYMIADSVARQTQLVHGQLHDMHGHSCAVGAFFNDNPKAVLHSALIDEIATYNDSMPDVTRRERRNRVLRWLRWRLKVLARGV